MWLRGAPTDRRTAPWILGVALIVLGVLAAYVAVPCADAPDITRTLSAVSVAAPTASVEPRDASDPCGHATAYGYASAPGASASNTSFRAPDIQAKATAEFPAAHRCADHAFRIVARTRTPGYRPAGLAIADLAVARI
jgi:hypothetical protein